MPITHEWNGTILTITSDSGTSSADLKGEKGDDGARGAQGVAGSCIAEDTTHLGGIAAEEYATKEYVDSALASGNIDLSDYATKTYVNDAIDNIQHPQPDLTGYATETYVEDYVEDALKDLEPSTGGETADLTNYYTKEEVNNAIKAAAYVPPVGIILPFWNNTEPAALYANTVWELVATGKTLIQAGSGYTLGSTGGESTHTLTTAELASHSHILRQEYPTGSETFTQWMTYFKLYNSSEPAIIEPWETDFSTTGYIYNTGGIKTAEAVGQPHNNMPPYLAVNLWKRTA